MRIRARYALLFVFLLGATTTLLYFRIIGSEDINDRRKDPRFNNEKWMRHRHQLLQNLNEARDEREAVNEQPHPPQQKAFSNSGLFPRNRKRDRAWNGPAFIDEMDQFEAAYTRHSLNDNHLVARTPCSPRHNITLLKVHKTGSSTLQNIFLRFGQRHKLTFVLPPHGHHLGFPDYFARRHMLPVKNEVYNIFCHHTRFSQVVINIMPPNTIYISILRDPVRVFESAFTYFKIDYRIGMTNDKDSMRKFLEDPMHYYQSAPSTVHMRNNMLYDFGVPTSKYDDTDFIMEAIKMIDNQFTLILIAEYFEESLILLRDALCWRTEDMVVFKMNSRKQTSVDTLQNDIVKDIRTWNHGDVLLYNHFNKTLWHKIEKFGREKMAKEVKKLQQLTESYYKLCIETDSADRKEGAFDVWQPPGVKINAFVLKDSAYNNPICENMVRPEIVYTAQLREAQFPHLSFRKYKQFKKRQKPTRV